MPTHLHTGFEEMGQAMKGVQHMQRLADHYGINNIFSDNGGKTLQVLVATGLDHVPGRTGPDASDRMGRQYEIKSTDVSAGVGFGTSHHLNESIIDRYRRHTFIFAVFDGVVLQEAYRVKAGAMEELFEVWEYKLLDADHLNNPKIPLNFVRKHGDIVYYKDIPAPWTPGKRRRTKPYRYQELLDLGLIAA